MRVNHKSIIVTGAGQGIGKGIALRLAQEGAQVIVNDINATLGEAVVAEIVAAGGTAAFVAADVTKSGEVKALVDAAVQHYGSLDVMVNNAGWTHRNRPALEVPEDEFDKCYAVNVKSIYLATVHATPVFRAQGGGSFINIASTAGVRPRPGLTWYNGSKGAVQHSRQLCQPGVQPRNRPVDRICRWPADRRPHGQIQVQHSPGPFLHRDRCGQCRAVSGQRRGGVHQRRVHRGGWRALRLQW